MRSLYAHFAVSKDPFARSVRAVYRYLRNFSLPAANWFFRPILAVYLFLRGVYYFSSRVFICEPFFKAYCTTYGRKLHTGPFIHWVQGSGQLIIGDNVNIDGKCSFIFAVRYTDNPILRIGNNVGIGHNSTFTIGREITIGDNVMIGGNIEIFDSPGHPADPTLRLIGSPALPEDVKPIHIEDNVWVGSGSTIFPGVTLGEGCIVARGAIVMSNVLPYTVVAGSPARLIARLGTIKESKESI
jgi:acetyltransferase-like isoleucine patch superfamily enzyme